VYVIHVDIKASAEYRNLISSLEQLFPNVLVISTQLCQWGGQGLVCATQDMLSVGLSVNDEWQHAILLSGTHLPTWPLDRIRAWLIPGKSMFRYRVVPITGNESENPWAVGRLNRVRWHYTVNSDGRMQRGREIELPDFTYVSGGQWVVLTREHAAYSVGHENSGIRSRLMVTDILDEAFFQTMLFNSEHFKNCVNELSTFTDWSTVPAPKSYTLPEYLAVIKDAKHPFVRKIYEDLGDEDAVFDAIDSVMGGVEVPDFVDIVKKNTK
jgi:hypothetical protein